MEDETGRGRRLVERGVAGVELFGRHTEMLLEGAAQGVAENQARLLEQGACVLRGPSD